MFPRTFAVGAHFGVVLVADDDADLNSEAEPQRFTTEVATFRSDLAYSDGRHPDAVRYTQSAEEDVQRRDFTINGMLLDVTKLNDARGSVRSAVLDYVDGLQDLDSKWSAQLAGRRRGSKKTICACCVRCDLQLASGLNWSWRRSKRSVHSPAASQAVSRERIRDELTNMLTEGRARRAFELLDETGLLEEVLPEIARMKGVEQTAPSSTRKATSWNSYADASGAIAGWLLCDTRLGRATA